MGIQPKMNPAIDPPKDAPGSIVCGDLKKRQESAKGVPTK